MKVLTISLSGKCLKVPRCNFCYQEGSRELTFEDLYRGKEMLEKKWAEEDITTCWEYNGYNISLIEKEWMFGSRQEKPRRLFTLTTAPFLVNPHLISYVKRNSKVGAISLSYNNEVVESPSEWNWKAQLLKEAGFKVSMNLLLGATYLPLEDSSVELADQVNLLSLKPNGFFSSKESLKVIYHLIEPLKAKGKTVATDNCLGIQLGTIDSCRRGKDFVHLTSEGKLEDCCFKDKCYFYTKPNLLQRHNEEVPGC